MRKSKSLTLIAMFMVLLSQLMLAAPQQQGLQRLEPANWWIGMQNPNVQLMAYGLNISATEVKLSYPGVKLDRIIKVENPNYLFLNLIIAPETQAGTVKITFSLGKKIVTSVDFELLQREPSSRFREGFNSADAMYLIMPDRFANGNPKNDDMPGMVEKADRKAPYGRHGGDLKGIQDNLDYIHQLGFTSIWLNPVQENNQPAASYHGYAITDYYKVDARLGTNADFQNLTQACRAKGIKMIMDMVFNHCGSNHWWMNDLPEQNWLNQFSEFTRSNYRLSTVSDPYVSQSDQNLTTRGWFDTTMPDLNLKNDLMLNYLIQNSIWWIEYAGLQGIRMDTYPYPDKDGMAIWAKRVMDEYPNFNIVGESWIGSAAKLCYWQKDFPNKDGFNSQLPSLMDFPLMEAARHAFNEKESWDNGLVRLYDVLADDHLYPDPMNLVVFPENHDIGRLMFFINEDVRKFKMMMAFMSTIRGLPQFYYGSEILMTGNGYDGHANIREDFPGGWPGDAVNAFAASGRTSVQNDAVDYLSKLLNYRKNSPVLHKGKLMHFLPQNQVYVYFRYLPEKAVMVILNNDEENAQTISTSRFNEIINQYSSGFNVMTGVKLQNLKSLEVPAKSATIIELTK